jgi:hypothetical protein
VCGEAKGLQINKYREKCKGKKTERRKFVKETEKQLQLLH